MAEGNSESGSSVRPTSSYNDSEDDIKLKLGNYVCPICLEIADKAVITTCCRKVYCELHCTPVAEAQRACPTCRAEPLQFIVAQFERDYIARFATRCPFCEVECERGRLEEHKQCCEQRPDPEAFSAARLYPQG